MHSISIRSFMKSPNIDNRFEHKFVQFFQKIFWKLKDNWICKEFIHWLKRLEIEKVSVKTLWIRSPISVYLLCEILKPWLGCTNFTFGWTHLTYFGLRSETTDFKDLIELMLCYVKSCEVKWGDAKKSASWKLRLPTFMCIRLAVDMIYQTQKFWCNNNQSTWKFNFSCIS